MSDPARSVVADFLDGLTELHSSECKKVGGDNMVVKCRDWVFGQPFADDLAKRYFPSVIVVPQCFKCGSTQCFHHYLELRFDEKRLLTSFTVICKTGLKLKGSSALRATLHRLDGRQYGAHLGFGSLQMWSTWPSSITPKFTVSP